MSGQKLASVHNVGSGRRRHPSFPRDQWKSLFTIKQNGSRIEHIKGKKTTKQDSENT